MKFAFALLVVTQAARLSTSQEEFEIEAQDGDVPITISVGEAPFDTSLCIFGDMAGCADPRTTTLGYEVCNSGWSGCMSGWNSVTIGAGAVEGGWMALCIPAECGEPENACISGNADACTDDGGNCFSGGNEPTTCADGYVVGAHPGMVVKLGDYDEYAMSTYACYPEECGAEEAGAGCIANTDFGSCPDTALTFITAASIAAGAL